MLTNSKISICGSRGVTLLEAIFSATMLALVVLTAAGRLTGVFNALMAAGADTAVISVQDELLNFAAENMKEYLARATNEQEVGMDRICNNSVTSFTSFWSDRSSQSGIRIDTVRGTDFLPDYTNAPFQNDPLRDQFGAAKQRCATKQTITESTTDFSSTKGIYFCLRLPGAEGGQLASNARGFLQMQPAFIELSYIRWGVRQDAPLRCAVYHEAGFESYGILNYTIYWTAQTAKGKRLKLTTGVFTTD